jgi:hypothetical protein
MTAEETGAPWQLMGTWHGTPHARTRQIPEVAGEGAHAELRQHCNCEIVSEPAYVCLVAKTSQPFLRTGPKRGAREEQSLASTLELLPQQLCLPHNKLDEWQHLERHMSTSLHLLCLATVASAFHSLQRSGSSFVPSSTPCKSRE